MPSLYDELSAKLARDPRLTRKGGPRADLGLLLFNAREDVRALWDAAGAEAARARAAGRPAQDLEVAVDALRPIFGPPERPRAGRYEGPMHHHEHEHPAPGGDAHFDAHGNPHDFEHYVSRLDDPERAEWQKPDEVVAALALEAGQVVGEIGSGVGTFTKRLARAVGEAGRVFAVDVEPRLLAVLRDRLAEARVTNVTPVLGFAEDPLLPPASCDVVLLVNTLHHFADPGAMLRRFAALLKPGGRLANVDFHRRETAMGPPLEHRIARETCVEQAKSAGLALASEPTFLEHQYFLVFRRG